MPAFDVPANRAFDDYNGLVDAINDWLDRSDLEGVAQQMIALAESNMRRELQPFFLETSASVTTVDGIGAFPTDYGI
ncbi:MAG: phage adaptor protein, partial [Beijerinckiaceae bacterium]